MVTMKKKASALSSAPSKAAKALLLGLSASIVVPATRALDVEIVNVQCDDLPVTADITMRCNIVDESGSVSGSSSRCTFGEYATIAGTLNYEGVDQSGTNGETVYMTGDLALLAIDFSLFEMMPVPLCYDPYYQADGGEVAYNQQAYNYNNYQQNNNQRNLYNQNQYNQQQAYNNYNQNQNQQNQNQQNQYQQNQYNQQQQQYQQNQYNQQQAYNNYNNYNQNQNQYNQQQQQYQQNQYNNAGNDDAAAAYNDANANANNNNYAYNGNYNNCPGDGQYDYTVDYKLPNAGKEQASWLATGFQGTGIVKMYAQQDEGLLIGQCYLTLQTYVTRDEEHGMFQIPTAATSLGVMLASIVALLLLSAYCYCCTTTKKQKYVDGDDATSHFRRLEEDVPPPTVIGGKSNNGGSHKASVVSHMT